MNQTSKTIGKLLKYAGPFRITILLSAIFAAFSAVINLKSYLCVYEVAKLLIQSAGNFGAINLAAMKELGFRAVYYVCMGFGMYGMSLLCSHISAYHTVARILWAGIHGYYVGLLFSRLYGTIGGHFCFYWWHNRRIHWKSRAEKALCQKRYNLMKSVLFGQKPTSRQLYLDARTKLILCLLTSFIMFSCNYTGVMRFVLPVLSALPFFSFLILKKYRTATGYILAYGICLFLPVVLRQYDAPFLNIMSAAIASIFTQMLPGLAMFNVLLSSTSVSEFIAAMDGVHISKKFSVPVSVMFRFFPTIREEYQFIRDALRLRGIGTLAHPSEMLEYRMVPLLTELVQVGNELSASAMTRGLDAPNKRTNVCRSGFHAQDIIAFVFCAVVIMLFIISKVLGL